METTQDQQLIQNLIKLQQELLDAIDSRDYKKYQIFVDKNVTSFEMEGKGALLSGLEFHKFWFDHQDGLVRQSTIQNPFVKLMANNTVAIIAYNRVRQTLTKDNKTDYQNIEETRIWEKKGEAWINVHFHRSISAN